MVSPPGTPRALEVTSETVELEWTAPQFDGGSDIVNYIVEKRQGITINIVTKYNVHVCKLSCIAHETRWLKCSFSNIPDCEYKVTELIPNESYQFRVIARNAAGTLSKQSNPSEIIICKDEKCK